jgi:hypothetical protein
MALRPSQFLSRFRQLLSQILESPKQWYPECHPKTVLLLQHFPPLDETAILRKITIDCSISLSYLYS